MDTKMLNLINDYWNATNYVSACQLYLLDNPLLERQLTKEDIKNKIVGHWGTVPGQNFIYVHLNRLIKDNNLDMIYLSGPGHGGNSQIASTYLEGSYSKVYPNITEDKEGLKKLFKQFSFPKGVPSHAAPETPGSINEGGELGYSLAHAFGAVLDNPNLIAACIIGDGEAETGPLATSWRFNKFLNPKKDGVVLPIIHINGYKIANPTILGRVSPGELKNYFKGLGYLPIFVEGSDPMIMHQKMYDALNNALEQIKNIKKSETTENVRWPVIVLKTPKGWTGPKVVNNKNVEGTFRAHQVPVNDFDNPENLKILEDWLKSYHPENLFDKNGKLRNDIKSLIPDEKHLMGLSPYANGGLLRKKLNIPNFKKYQVDVPYPGETVKEDMRVLGTFIRDIIKENPNNFKIFGPDEALSNRLDAVFEVDKRKWNAEKYDFDEFLSQNGNVLDGFLSEHFCEGALEGYLLTGRHGFFHSYEAFIRIIDSMASQHAKWLKISKELTWRKDISSLNYVLTSHVWQQDHNGYTHQDPGFLNHLVTKKADIVRMYLPPDANCLLSCFNHIIKTENYINVIVASKHERMQWLNMNEAVKHCSLGIGTWDFCSNDKGNPDVVLACCGDTPTLEVIACYTILRKFLRDIKIRVINVVDLMRLLPNNKHPHGLPDEDYDRLFTKDKPIIFAFHGYPSLIHELTYKRTNQDLHVRGYNEEGTITTPFDMRVLNKIDRFNLALDVLKYTDNRFEGSNELKEYCTSMLKEHDKYIREYGIDMPEITEFNFKKEMELIEK